MVEKENPLEIAKEYGRKIAGEMGAETFAELQYSFVNTILPRFSNNTRIRMVQHILLYGDQGYLKSTSLNEFIRCLPGDTEVLYVSSSSTEALFGSISDDGAYIKPPLFLGVKIAKIDELTSFLGSGNQMRDKVNPLNTVMEGDIVTRTILKANQEEFPEEKIEELRNQGIDYFPHKGQISFRSDACFWAATRPIDNRTYTYLKASGHLYRYHILQNQISDEQSRRLFTQDIKIDEGLQEKLRQLNTKLSQTQIKEIQTPSESTLNRIFTGLEEIINDEFRTKKKRLAEIIDMRTKGDIIREMAAHASIRNAIERDYRTIERVEYTPEDEESILERLPHFIEFKINPVFTEEFSEKVVKRKRPREEVQDLIIEFLRTGEKQRKDIDQYVNDRVKVSTATISNTLAYMLKLESVYQPRHGTYRLRGPQDGKEECEYKIDGE